ncbi:MULTISPECIES: hypothetical protein [unclassified Mameliella]|uniref:hypothetical protein n=1 Tax=Mameliella sp. LZ-28 TaxID=2484146 RepID=UPI00143F7C06|nr:hypothetical protein [Mameliella sp. LZ-28]MCR9276227.1 hypothetical protein [Paracoccaceae bacterium]
MSDDPKFLILKRGLYYRPEAKGYTALKEHAGRYSLDEVAVRMPNGPDGSNDGISFIAEDDAPDCAPSADVSIVADYWQRKATEYASQVEDMKAALANAAEGARRQAVRDCPYCRSIGRF